MSIHLYVEDVDAFVKRAVAAGARELKPVANQFLAPPHLHVLALSSTPFQAFSGPEDGVRLEECKSAIGARLEPHINT